MSFWAMNSRAQGPTSYLSSGSLAGGPKGTPPAHRGGGGAPILAHGRASAEITGARRLESFRRAAVRRGVCGGGKGFIYVHKYVCRQTLARQPFTPPLALASRTKKGRCPTSYLSGPSPLGMDRLPFSWVPPQGGEGVGGGAALGG